MNYFLELNYIKSLYNTLPLPHSCQFIPKQVRLEVRGASTVCRGSLEEQVRSEQGFYYAIPESV